MDVLRHFNLKESPFSISPDPRFLFLSDQVNEALAKCEYMARERIGPIYMYGPIGSGKTSIMRRLYERLSQEKQYNVKLVISPNVKSSNAFLRMIMEEFDVKTERAYDQSLKNFNHFLLESHKQNRIPLLLIDEAQNLNRDTLKLIHYLLNFETNQVKLLQIVLAGQEELATKIIQYKELASRMFPISTSAMSLNDLKEMIQFRWMVSGGKDLPFHDGAYKTIFTYSKGLPRDAVKLCDETLRYMTAKEVQEISLAEVEQIAKSFNLTK